MFYQLLLFLPIVLSAAPLSRVCNPDKSNVQYTGFRVDKQIFVEHQVIKGYATHLSLCKDGYLINDFHIDDLENSGVPWNQTLCNAAQCYKLSRSKQYALRPISVFAPGKLVGGLFELKGRDLEPSEDGNYSPVERLVADPLYDQWIEVNKKSDIKVFHIPLLHTPDITDRKFGSLKDIWFETISANERYKFSPETNNKYKNSVNMVLEQLRNVIQNSSKQIKSLSNQISDSKPVRKPIKAVNVPKKENVLLGIYRKTIDSLSKKRFSKTEVDFDTLTILSYILPHQHFDQFLKNLNVVYDKITTTNEKFKYEVEPKAAYI